MTSPIESHKWEAPPPKQRPRWRKNLGVLLLVLGLLATTTAVVGAQTPQSNTNAAATPGTCADAGMSVVEPLSVSWESDSDPVLNPRYLWAYGDVDLLWDDSVDDYWFHWYNAVPGPDPYVVYRFAPATVIEGVQFTNDWSDGDLELLGLGNLDQPVSGVNTVALDDPFVSYVAPLASMTVAAVKMTTSDQQVKLLEVDFCGEADTTTSTDLNLVVSAGSCESISATWTPLPGADHQVSVTDSNNVQVNSQNGLVSNYGPVALLPGAYTVTLTATATAGPIVETMSVVVTECSTTSPGCGSSNDAADAYCDSINVIDSFGDAPLPTGANTGMRWNTVTEYYNSYGNRSGMCSIDVHNSYWTAVRDADGGLTYYPSWHPPIHDPGGAEECRFTHEHGLDPRTSDLYDEDHPTNIGAPFGFVHPGMGGHSGRVEDHVGHKIVVENDLQLTTNNPYGAGITLSLFELNGQPVTCDWYSKLHQGTHSTDALGFNMHEYYLNYSCDDGTEVRVKEMTDFGFRTPGESDAPNFPLTGGQGTVNSDCGWFTTNLPGPASDPDPSDDSDFGDAGRGFTCLMSDAKIEELWKPSAYISAPDGAGTLAYDPYYVVMNPNRFALYEWWEYLDQDGDHVGENAMISMVDFCVDGSELRNELMRSQAPSNFVKSGHNITGQFRIQTYCDSIEASVLDQWAQDIDDAGGDNATLMAERKFSADNAFIGTRRGVHTKGPVLYGRRANFDSLAFFCSDHFGNGAVWPTNPDTGAAVTTDNPWSQGDPTPVCDSGVPQILSTFANNHGPVEGSTAGATVTGGGFQSNGPASEITIDMDARYPNHGVQAPN